MDVKPRFYIGQDRVKIRTEEKDNVHSIVGTRKIDRVMNEDGRKMFGVNL